MAAIKVEHLPKPRYIQTGDKAPVHIVEISPAELLALLGGGVSGIISNPPSGCYKVTNIYVENGKLVAKWDDIPA